MLPISFRTAGAVILVVLILSGCRTYGSRGSEAATYAQMQRATAVFKDELARARSELSVLQQAGASSPYAASIVEQYQSLVASHEALVETQEKLVESLSEESGYRGLSRAFGAINVQQQTIRSQYQRLLQGVHSAAADTSARIADYRPLHLIPPFYNRVAAAQRNVSTNEVLAILRGQPVRADTSGR